MATRKWRMMAVLLPVALLPTCTSSGGSSPVGVGDSSSLETIRNGCSSLGREACGASDVCEPYLAWPKDEACVAGEPAEAPSFLGCYALGSRECNSAWTWGHSRAPVGNPASTSACPPTARQMPIARRGSSAVPHGTSVDGRRLATTVTTLRSLSASAAGSAWARTPGDTTSRRARAGSARRYRCAIDGRLRFLT